MRKKILIAIADWLLQYKLFIVLSTQTTKPQSTCSCYSSWIEILEWQNGSVSKFIQEKCNMLMHANSTPQENLRYRFSMELCQGSIQLFNSSIAPWVHLARLRKVWMLLFTCTIKLLMIWTGKIKYGCHETCSFDME